MGHPKKKSVAVRCGKFLVSCCCCATPANLRKYLHPSLPSRCNSNARPRLAIGMPMPETVGPFQRNTVIRNYDPRRAPFSNAAAAELLDSQDPTLTRFDLLTLGLATDNFSVEIGRTQFGVVYKGVLPDGSSKPIAVAVLRGRVSSLPDPLPGAIPHSTRLADVRFLSAIAEMARIKSRNVVQLIGFCLEHRYTLVFDYKPFGDLDSALFNAAPGGASLDGSLHVPDQNQDTYLDWEARVSIADDIASGMNQIHEFWRNRPFCCHLTAKSVLLDKELVAHVTDYGLGVLWDLLLPLLPRESQSYSASDNSWKIYSAPEYLASIATTGMNDGELHVGREGGAGEVVEGRERVGGVLGRGTGKEEDEGEGEGGGGEVGEEGGGGGGGGGGEIGGGGGGGEDKPSNIMSSSAAEGVSVISEKNDVYSFGILLLELITGRKSASLPSADLPTWPNSPLTSHHEARRSVVPPSYSPSSVATPKPIQPPAASVCVSPGPGRRLTPTPGSRSPMVDLSLVKDRLYATVPGTPSSSTKEIHKLPWGYLPDAVSMFLQAGKVSQIVDPRLRGKFSRSQADRLIRIGLVCSNKSPQDRPLIKEVLLMLGGVMAIPLPHCAPAEDEVIPRSGYLSPTNFESYGHSTAWGGKHSQQPSLNIEEALREVDTLRQQQPQKEASSLQPSPSSSTGQQEKSRTSSEQSSSENYVTAEEDNVSG